MTLPDPSHPGMRRVALALALVMLAAVATAGCRPRGAVTARRSFYYWRTAFALTDGEKERLGRHHVERLYLRLFDVAWDKATGRALPVGRVRFNQPPPAGVEIVPVVFVSNSVFENNQPAPEALADKVWALARGVAAEAGFGFSELQIDCDWSEGTREAFFAFCRRVRASARAASVGVSATIRLHQIKYRERTGVPPVDRGMLMFYNMGQLAAEPVRSSIFNAQDASLYVASIDSYPLPLDAALAVFSWAVHGRQGRVVGLLDKTGAATLDALPALRRLAPGRYVAAEATLLHGSYLQKGDTLAIEAMPPAQARAAAALLAEHFHPRHDLTIALFDLDERNLTDYAPTDLEALFTAVR